MNAEDTRESVSLAAGGVAMVGALPGCTGLSVYVDAGGQAGIDGAVVRVYGRRGAIRAQVGGDTVVPSRSACRVVAVRGVGADAWEVELVAVSAITNVRVTSHAYGSEP